MVPPFLPRFCFLFLPLLGFLFACPPSSSLPDGGLPEPPPSDLRCFSGPPTAPRILDIAFLGSLPGQPRLLRFLARWQDSDQDLRDGQILSWIDGLPSSPLPFPPGSSSPQGETRLYLDLTGLHLPHSKTIAVEFQFLDRARHPSNRFLLLLQAQR